MSENKVSILDHGYCQFIEKWGTDERIIEAARMSTGKGFLGWEPGVCPICNGEKGELEDTGGFGQDSEPISVWIPCSACESKGTIAGDKNLLRRLWVMKHATPFEMAGLIVEVQAPIMVFREWHRHRTQSFNEMSGRYTALPNVNYTPSAERLLIGSDGKNKQAGTIKDAVPLTHKTAVEFQNRLERMWSLQEELYQWALTHGVPKELARTHIGVGRYSRMRASANLRNWLGFLTLRMDQTAQWEIRQYANEVGNLISQHFPRTWTLFMEGKS